MTRNTNQRVKCIEYQIYDVVLIKDTDRKASQQKLHENGMMPSGIVNGTQIGITYSRIYAYYTLLGKEVRDRDRNKNSGRMVDEPYDGTDMIAEPNDGGKVLITSKTAESTPLWE